jgi:hypothetical protein
MMITLTYGQFPSLEVFASLFETQLEGHFRWTLRGQDATAIEHTRLEPSRSWTDSGLFYDDMVYLFSTEDDIAQGLVSSVLNIMGVKWV